MNYGNLKVGCKVRTLRELKTGVRIIPVGSIGVVERRYKGLSLYFENRCPYCKYGDRNWVSRVDLEKVELVLETPTVSDTALQTETIRDVQEEQNRNETIAENEEEKKKEALKHLSRPGVE